VARSTLEKKFEAARAKYEAELKVIGAELRDSIVAMLAPLIPEGWFLAWNQADDCYNDEDYYFDVQSLVVCTEREPRQGKLLKEETPPRYEPNQWGGMRCIDSGSPAEHEWILDDQCEQRDHAVFSYEEYAGVASLKEYWKFSLDTCGLVESDVEALAEAFRSIGDKDLRRAFGDRATVRVNRDGTYEVK
jgi:hypothetical protein